MVILQGCAFVFAFAKKKLKISRKKITLKTFCANHPLRQGSPNLILEGRCPAEFSSNLSQHTWLEVWSIPSKSLISCFRCVWLGLELNSAGHRPSRTVSGDPCFKGLNNLEKNLKNLGIHPLAYSLQEPKTNYGYLFFILFIYFWMTLYD